MGIKIEDQISEYLTWSEERLLDELGRSLLGGDGLRVGSEDSGRRRRFSREWLEDLREDICGKDNLRGLTDNSPGNQILEVATLVDTVASPPSPTSAILAAVLVVRIGLRQFCSDCWAE